MFEKLLKEVFGAKTKVVNNTIIKDLGKNVAHIKFSDSGYQNHFNKISVTIVNKETLKSFNQNFDFKNYLNKRIDNRKDYSGDIHVWGDMNGKVDWYIAKPHPDELKKMVKDINDYIKLYKVQ